MNSGWIFDIKAPSTEQRLILSLCLANDRIAAENYWLRLPRLQKDLADAVAGGRPALKRLLPLIHHALAAHGVSIEASARAVLNVAALWERQRARRIIEIAGGVLDTLERAGVEPVVLKGLALSEIAYPISGVRHCHDIDLLVPRESLLQAGSALERCGMTPCARPMSESGTLCFVHPGGLPICLHDRLFTVEGLATSKCDVLARTWSITIAGRPTRMLHPVDLILQLCCQLFLGTARDSVSWAPDLTFLLRRFNRLLDDRQLLRREAENSGLWRGVSAMLAFLQHDLRIPIERASGP